MKTRAGQERFGYTICSYTDLQEVTRYYWAGSPRLLATNRPRIRGHKVRKR